MVVGLDRQPILNQSEIYSGVYGYVNVSFYAYFSKGRKGIGCGLNSVLKTRDGQPLSGSAPTVDEAFAGIGSVATPGAMEIDPITGLPIA